MAMPVGAIISLQDARQSFLDYISDLALELELELRKKNAIQEEEIIEMDGEIWKRLPEELLMRAVAHLPALIILEKIRLVCKPWSRFFLPPAIAFQQMAITVPPCSFPAFLIGGLRLSHMMSPIINDLFLLHSLPIFSMYRLSLDFVGSDCGSVETTCRSLLCCSRSRQGTPTLFYICNPVIRTCKMLPPPIQLSSKRHFIALAFHPSTRRCMLVIGVNSETREGGNKNNMVMEIYDSETDAWTKLEMDLPLSVWPRGEGIFSRGTFYWINNRPVGQDRPILFRYDVAAFNVAEKHWDVIRQPQRTDATEFEYTCYWKLTGYDGKVVLLDQKDLSMWKLNEEEGGERQRWLELQAFPRSLREEAVNHGNIIKVGRNPQTIGFTFTHPQVVINSCGWVFVHLHGNKLVVLDAEGRMMRSIEGKLLTVFEQAACPIPLHAYEINNVWWP